MEPIVRPARLDDADAVEAFTANTWIEHGGDYVPGVFESWVESDGAEARTLVAEVDGRAVGLLRTALLSPEEAWCGGLRVGPDHRGEGLAARLVEGGLDWARKRGATVARAMVFSWNAAGLGVARATGFEPATEFRWAHPEPDPDAASTPDRSIHPAESPSPGAAWTYWQDSQTRNHLRGLALDPDEPWALSALTRERLARAADGDRLLVVRDGGTRGFAVRVRVAEYPGDGRDPPERWAEYGVADWADTDAAAALLDAVARDAASVGADRTRVLIPETVRAVSDAALARVPIADAPDFVLAADPTRR